MVPGTAGARRRDLLGQNATPLRTRGTRRGYPINKSEARPRREAILLRDGVESALDDQVASGGDFIGRRETGRLRRDLLVQTALDPRDIGGPFVDAGLNAPIGGKGLKIVEHRRGD